METIVFLDRASLVAEVRRPAFEHVWREYQRTAPGEAAERVRDATVVITNKVVLDRESLAGAPRVKLVAVAATGVNVVDLGYCRERGIAVCNIRDYAVHTVPEHVFMMMLALRRNLLGWRQDVHAGRWNRAEQFCLFTREIGDLFGATLGVVGHGSIGRSVARLGEAFGMRVLLAERKGAAALRPGYTPFDAVLREADVLTLHLPLTPESRGLLGAGELAAMKPGAILINTARGGLVDERALVASLESGHLGGAGFDVLTVEPPVEGHPLVDLDLPNFILTPHVAWASRGAMQRLADQLIDNIEAFAAGRPRSQVL
jgi:glycerate dehydrogenase